MKAKRKKKRTLLEANLLLKYYYGKKIIEPYYMKVDRLVIDNDCLDLLDNPEEMFYITPLSKIDKKKK